MDRANGHIQDLIGYADDALSGKTPVCQYIRLAAQRFIDDLDKQKQKDFPFYFCEQSAIDVIEFGEMLKHVKGKWRGQNIKIGRWEKFLLGNLFGWKRKTDNKRRFRELYAEIPRKNGKSTLMALIGLYMLVADGEGAPEVYSGATSEKQAHEVFAPAWKMCNASPELKNFFGINLTGSDSFPTGIFCTQNGGKFISIIGNPGDGPSPSCSITDEYHEHRTSVQYDTMETGMAAREQPIRLVVTTAGVNISFPCYEKRADAIRVLNGTLDNDELFTLIYTIDDNDDWKDFDVWIKANPNYGVSVFDDFLRARYTKAMQKAESQNILLCKHLNVWSNSSQAFINIVDWDKQKVNLIRDGFPQDVEYSEALFEGEECAMGMDLASKIDIAAYCKLFKRGNKYFPFLKYYLPERAVMRPENDHYRRWADEGRLIVTPGASTDYLYIEEDIKADAKRFQVRGLGYDPYESGYLVNNLSRWESNIIQCVEVSQTAGVISGPMKDFEGIVESGNMLHDGDPILKWMVGNVVKKESRHKKYYPSRENAKNKIDGFMTILFSLIVWQAEMENEASVYESRGVVII